MSLPSFFYSNRLTLRSINISDHELIYDSWACDPEVAKYTPRRVHNSKEDTKKYILECIDKKKASTEFTYIAWETGKDIPVGCLSLRPRTHMVEVGYLISQANWRKGFATEMVSKSIEIIFSSTSFIRIWAYCDIDNLASVRVMQKAGMREEGILRSWAIHPNISNIPRDVRVFSILSREVV